MATGGVGGLTVTLGLDAANFTNGLTKAQQQAQQFSVQAYAIGTAIGEGIRTGVEKAVDYLKELTVGSIDALDHLNDLSQKTGVAAQTLGGIGFAASQAGGDLDSIAVASGKLNKSLAEATAGNKQAKQAFDALGLGALVAAGNTTTVDTALVAIAGKFEGFADGPNKVALALRLFGKAGADIIPFLNDGSKSLQENIAFYQRYSGVTNESAKAADEFNDTLGKISVISKAFGKTLAAELLPSLQAIADQYLSLKENSTTLGTSVDIVAGIFKGLATVVSFVAFTFVATGDKIGAFIAQLGVLGSVSLDAYEKFAKFDFKGVFASAAGGIGQLKAISQASADDLNKTRKQYEDFQAAINAPKKAPPAPGDVVKKPNAPGLPDASGAGQADTLLKKQLDGQLKIINSYAQQQKDAYEFANKYVEGTYTDALESQTQFFAEQGRIRSAGLQATLKQLDDEAAAIKAAQAKAQTPVVREELNTKLVDVTAQRVKAVQDGAQAEVLANQTNERSVKALADAYANLQASIATAQGNDLTAAKIRIDQQVEAARKLAVQAGKSPGEASDQANLYGEQLKGLAELQDAQRKNSQFTSLQSNKEATIAAQGLIDGKGEIAQLLQVGQIRQATVATLTAQADAAQKLADTLGTPEATKFASDLQLALKQAQAQIDPLQAKINGLFTDNFGSAFADFITGAKSAKDAFGDFAKGVVNNLAQIAAKELATSLFGGTTSGTGSSSGAGGGFAGLLTTIGSFFGFGGTKLATGTNYVPYDGFQATLHEGEAVVPKKYNPAAGGQAARSSGGDGMSLTINQQFAAGTSGATTQQAAVQAADAIARARRDQ